MLMKKCPACNKYTLKDVCCEKTKNTEPPRFLSEQRYGKYRRIAKIKRI